MLQDSMADKKAAKTKLFHVITSLDQGGAEMMLYRLLEFIDKERFENLVVSLIPAGVMMEKIRALGIPAYSLGMQPGRPSISAFFRLVGLLRRERPAIIHTWMYHADLMGGLAACLNGKPVVWGIHNTSLDPAFVKRNTIRIARLNARLSHYVPRRVIVCSDESRKQHVKIGYDPKKFITIPNGYDLDLFHPDPPARKSLRKGLGLPMDVLLIGLVARFDPLKDHRTFTEAAGLLLSRYPRTHFVLCGRNISPKNEVLEKWINATRSPLNFHLLGQRDDMPGLMAGLDINTLSSVGEAFPNVLGEAMACGIPCVTTDVGDAAEIVGDAGVIVPAGDPRALADGWARLISMTGQQRTELGRLARERIGSHYHIKLIVKQYEDLYIETLHTKRDSG
jgi:glycosyltransferase involved in cell wall biosynthesis